MPTHTTRFRVLITGSRTWTNADAITYVLNQLHAWQGNRLVIVHGACPSGADAIAETWCRLRSVSAERHPANWSRHGKAAGPIRNAEMVKTRPVMCVAFIHGNSRGATHCADFADRAGILTVQYHKDEVSGRVGTRQCPDCGNAYPRLMPIDQDPRCWTCWLENPGWWETLRDRWNERGTL